MTDKKEMTAPAVSVGADTEQSVQINTNNSITSSEGEIKRAQDIYNNYLKEMQHMLLPSYLKTITMPDLYNTVFDTQTPLIEGLLCRGTYLFVGSPKVGKSFMMAQIAYHISTGKSLWNYKVQKVPVLYFALEDDYPRLQRRLYQMFGTEEAADLYLATESKKLGSGLEDQINGFLYQHPNTGLVIIDTLKRIREGASADYSYATDYDIVARLKAIADSRRITMLIVHHTRKQHADDKFDMISGTNGLLGAADGAFVLSKRHRTDNDATLDITGRDQQDMRLNLTRDESSLVWKLGSVETELWKEPPEPLLDQISDFVFSAGDLWEGTPTELAAALGVDMKPNVLTLKLNIHAGRLFTEYGIRYENKRSHDGRKVKLSLEQP